MKQNDFGKQTEELIAKIMRNKGYYVYRTPMKFNGQPIDIISAKGIGNNEYAIVYLIDSKHVREEEVSFTFNRIEPNQITTFMYAKEYAKLKNLGFAILFDRTGLIYWLPFEMYLEAEKNGKKSVNLNELELFEKVLI